MLKSCRYCNQLHPFGFVCPKKPVAYKIGNDRSKFRSTQEWTRKAENIKERDLYLCQLCIRKLYDIGKRQYNYESLQVHHIIPLVSDWERRLDNKNLLTLCQAHHRMAERGKIPEKLLLQMAEEQEKRKQ